MNPELKKKIITGVERVLAPRILWPGLLVLFLAISIFGWLFRTVPTRKAVLFFPRSQNLTLAGESRPVLPGGDGLEGSARNVVEELLLGPADSRFLPVLPKDTRVRETLYRKGRLYVDLSEEAVFARNPPLPLGLEAVRKTLRYNFPTLGGIILTINGREPETSAFQIGAEAKKKEK